MEGEKEEAREGEMEGGWEDKRRPTLKVVFLNTGGIFIWFWLLYF